jgi:hypothetical protein
MANESSLYNIGFEEAIGEESVGREMYRNIHVYSKKDDSECMVLPFYFIMGKHDYLWNEDGDRLLLSACYGFYEYDAEILPEKYTRWHPLMVVVDVADKHIVKVYEGDAALRWNDDESDIMVKSGLKKFSYDEWSAKYEAEREEVEKLVEKLASDYTMSLFATHNYSGRHHVIGDIGDELIEEKIRREYPEEVVGSEEFEKKLNRAKMKHYIIVIVVLGALMLLLWLIKGH